MPKPYPREFRDDVVRVARNRVPGVAIEQIAKDFGVHSMILQKWMCRADIGEGSKPGQARTEAAEIWELKKRNRLVEQEAEVLRRAAATPPTSAQSGPLRLRIGCEVEVDDGTVVVEVDDTADEHRRGCWVRRTAESWGRSRPGTTRWHRCTR